MATFLQVALFLTTLASASAQDYHIERIYPANSGARILTTEVLPSAQYSIPLTSKVARPAYKQAYTNALRGGRTVKTAVLAGSGGDSEYLTDITVGGQKFKVIVDTGSSDTWLAAKGFKCYNLTSYPEPPAECAFGPTFDPKKSKTFVPIKNENFNISYGDGEFLTGSVGSETITVGGLTATKQTMGVVNFAAWNGDGVNSGLFGLAYPSLTSVYNGSNPNADSRSNILQYDPFFYTAVKQGKSRPYFSIALNRGSFKNQATSSYDPHLGYLAFGGLAPVKTIEPCVTVPVQGFTVSSTATPKYMFYTVNIYAYIFNGTSPVTGSGKHAILDSGTTLNYLPTALADAYNARFVPPAVFSADAGVYYVDCDAKVPSFAVQIGGKKFTIDAKDQILPSTGPDGKVQCISGTTDGGDPADPNSLYIMGDTFLHNVVATFNIKTEQISLSQRAKY
jgi:hypothetical protein